MKGIGPSIPLLGAARVTGLLAPNIIRWLLDEEPEIKSRIEEIIASGKLSARVAIAGPPASEADMRTLLDAGGSDKKQATLPTITLLVNIGRHPVNGQLACQVDASPEDIDDLLQWPARRQRLRELQQKHMKRRGVTRLQ